MPSVNVQMTSGATTEQAREVVKTRAIRIDRGTDCHFHCKCITTGASETLSST
jgi:hypothetical protein